MQVDHGTDRNNAIAIKKEGFKDIPRYTHKQIVDHSGAGAKHFKSPGSLGYGIYAFLDNPEMAFRFASESSDNPSVVEFSVNDNGGDSTLSFVGSGEDTEKFFAWIDTDPIQRLLDHLKNKYKNIPNKQHALDGAMIELYIDYLYTKTNNKIDIVVSPTHTNINKQRDLLVPNGIEVAIRDKRIIEKDSLHLKRLP